MSPMLDGFQSALIVEDERNLASALRVAFRKLGIPAKFVTTLSEARRSLAESPPELLILDRNLPDGDGLELCREIRSAQTSSMILMLTARGTIDDRVEGLREGADDYLPKPFAWEELSARIEALARRKSSKVTHSQSSNQLEDTWQIDEGRLRIHGPTGWVDLTPLEFKLAKHLIDAQGEIVSRDTLLKSVWGFTLLPKTRTVDHFLGRLRKHFEKNPEEPAHFITVRGAGYRFQR